MSTDQERLLLLAKAEARLLAAMALCSEAGNDLECAGLSAGIAQKASLQLAKLFRLTGSEIEKVTTHGASQ